MPIQPGNGGRSRNIPNGQRMGVLGVNQELRFVRREAGEHILAWIVGADHAGWPVARSQMRPSRHGWRRGAWRLSLVNCSE